MINHTMNLVVLCPTTTSLLTFNHNPRRRNPNGWIIPSPSPFLICSASSHSNASVSPLDNATVSLFQASCDQHLQSACNLRVRTFCHVPQHTFRAEGHLQYLSAIEFEALKEKVDGKRTAFGKVRCVLATLPSTSIDCMHEELLSLCKIDGEVGTSEDQVVVGSLDLNQNAVLPNELVGSRPEGNTANQCRGYLSNVCVAKELQRKRIGQSLIAYTRTVAISLGITDLYTHVAIGNESAIKLYEKCGFIQESMEKSSEARLMGRPPRLLLWLDLRQG